MLQLNQNGNSFRCIRHSQLTYSLLYKPGILPPATPQSFIPNGGTANGAV
jgi:hypothetical protein